MSDVSTSLNKTDVHRDEAFELGLQWAGLYPEGSPTRALIQDTMNSSYLVNIVANDFKHGEIIFEPFLLDLEAAVTAKTTVNGTNGTATGAVGKTVDGVRGYVNGVVGGVEGAVNGLINGVKGTVIGNGH